ncbi:CD23 protein [Aphelenchoides avenae]|nr:CD23 protein [Aphelenchus avenae]
MAFRLVLFFSACQSVARGLCPAGSVQGVGANDCYIYSLKPKFWFDADIECKTKYGGALASVHGDIANAFILNPVSGSCLADFWLGATNDQGARWAWTDGSSFGYTHWATG